MFRQTTAPIRDQIRPFTREIRPLLNTANEASQPFSKTVHSFGNSLGAFNSFLNELAYKPKGSKQSFLFYLPWLNHDYNASFNLQDAGGPIQRGMVMITCNGANLGYGFALTRKYLQTLLEITNVPRPKELPALKDPKLPTTVCGPSATQ
jgi:phospholipid/cholesterol/gamma-HCH transport system substrate-binding protein